MADLNETTAAVQNLFDVEEEQQDTEQKPFDRKLFQRMLRYILPYKSIALLAAFFVSLRTLMSVLEPLVVRNAIDKGIEVFDFKYLILMTFVYLILS